MTCLSKADVNGTFDDFDVYANESIINIYNCSYNNVIFSLGFKYYVQECLGPDVPVVFLVETATNYRLTVLDPATSLRNNVSALQAPRVSKIEVIIEDHFKSQVKLIKPPHLKEYQDVVFPLILIM